MIVFFYEKVRLKRGAWQTVSIVLLIAFLCAFFTLFDGFICQKEQDMESAYEVIPVLQSRDGFFESAKADWHYFC